MTTQAKSFIALMAMLGTAALVNAGRNFAATDVVMFSVLAVAASLAARLKLKLPGLDGTMSMNLPFVLGAIAIAPGSAVLIGCFSTLAQTFRTRKPHFNFVHALFNTATMAFAVEVTRTLYVNAAFVPTQSARIAFATGVFFVLNTLPVAIIMSLTESKPVFRTWGAIFNLSFAYYVMSAGLAGTLIAGPNPIGYQGILFLVPVMFGVAKSFRTYFGGARAEALQEKFQAAAVASLAGR